MLKLQDYYNVQVVIQVDVIIVRSVYVKVIQMLIVMYVKNLKIHNKKLLLNNIILNNNIILRDKVHTKITNHQQLIETRV